MDGSRCKASKAARLAKVPASGDQSRRCCACSVPTARQTPWTQRPSRQLPPGDFWIDLLNPTREEERLAEKALGQNIPTREEMVEIEPSSRLYERHGALFMTASVVHGVTDGKPDTDPVSFILTDKLLVTVRYVDPKPFVAFFSHLCSEPEIAPDPLSVLVRLLDAIIDRLADELEATARSIETVSAPCLRASDKEDSKTDRPENRLEAILLRIGERPAAAGGNPGIGAEHEPHGKLPGNVEARAGAASICVMSKACRATCAACSTMTISCPRI